MVLEDTKCAAVDIFPNADLLAEADRQAIETYLEPFHKPVIDDGSVLCLKCNERLNSTFRWGLAHGEGACSNCGWPTRLYHKFSLSDGAEQPRLVFCLQYKPSLVKRRGKRR